MNGDGMLCKEGRGIVRVGGWQLRQRFDLIVSSSFLLFFGWKLFFVVVTLALAVLCTLYNGLKWTRKDSEGYIIPYLHP